MPDRLPPLNALRAFEAAQRHMSFQKAAEELYVTPAALSYQIRQLEEHLQIKLFTRLNRAVELTAEGHLIAPGLEAAFNQMRKTLARLKESKSENVLVISAGPALAANWLTPRIYRFLSRHSDIDLRISASLNLVNLHEEDVDIALRFGRGVYAGCHSVHLMDDYLTPMCAPQLLEGEVKLESPQDLVHVPLIYDDTHFGDLEVPGWEDWLAAAGMEDILAGKRGAHFDVANNAMAAAIAGAGVVLGRTSLAENELKAGRLIMPFELKLKSRFSFFAVTADHRKDEPNIVSFFNWLEDELSDPSEAPSDEFTRASKR